MASLFTTYKMIYTFHLQASVIIPVFTNEICLSIIYAFQVNLFYLNGHLMFQLSKMQICMLWYSSVNTYNLSSYKHVVYLMFIQYKYLYLLTVLWNMINYLLPVSLPCMHANNTIRGDARSNDVGSQVHCIDCEKTAGHVINGREALLHKKKPGVPEIHA